MEVCEQPIGEQRRHKLVRALRGRVRRDKDAVVIITGDEGTGKSVLAWKLCKEFDDRATFVDNVLFDPSVPVLYEMIYNLPKYSGVVVDELVRVGFRRNWFTADNKRLVELYALCRDQNKGSFWCIPRFSLIDTQLSGRAVFWVHVISRGLAIVLAKDKNQFTKDPWHFRDNEKLLQKFFRGKALHNFSLQEYVRAMYKSPNFVGWISFPDFTPEEKQGYKALKKPYELRDPSQMLSQRELKLKRDLERYQKAFALASAELVEQGKKVGEVAQMAEISYSTLKKVTDTADVDLTAAREAAREKKKRSSLGGVSFD